MAITGTWDVTGLSRRRLLAGGATAAAALALPLPAYAGGRKGHGGHGPHAPSPWQPLVTDPGGRRRPAARASATGILQSRADRLHARERRAPVPATPTGWRHLATQSSTAVLVRNHEG